jgi:hypothetical protein
MVEGNVIHNHTVSGSFFYVERTYILVVTHPVQKDTVDRSVRWPVAEKADWIA